MRDHDRRLERLEALLGTGDPVTVYIRAYSPECVALARTGVPPRRAVNHARSADIVVRVIHA